jgi:hypothetical protein
MTSFSNIWQRTEAHFDRARQSGGAVILFAIGLFLFGAVIILSSLPTTAALRLIMWALAFSMSGTVIGFVFGIPRDDGRTVNNNLVEISDWLTKIIVGVGLTQLNVLPHDIGKMAKFMVQMGPSDAPNFSISAAGATLIFFSAHGFLHGYLLTRLLINILFAVASTDLAQILGRQQQQELVEDSVSPETLPDDLRDAQSDPKLRAIASMPIDQISNPKEIATWAKANLKLGNYVAAINGYTRAALQLPSDPRVAAELGMAQFGANRDPNAVYLQLLQACDLLGPKPDPKLRRDIVKWLAYVSLYRQRPEGYTDTIEIVERYLADRDAEPSGGILINLACALGQKYSVESNKGATKEQLDAIESAALDALKKALIIRPGYRSHVGKLLHGEIPGDDDLVVFKGKALFEALVTEASTDSPVAANSNGNRSSPDRPDIPSNT